MLVDYTQNIKNTLDQIAQISSKLKDKYRFMFEILDSSVLGSWHHLNVLLEDYYKHKKTSNINDLIFEKRVYEYYTRYQRDFDRVCSNYLETYKEYLGMGSLFRGIPFSEPVVIRQCVSGDFLDFYSKQGLIHDDNFSSQFIEEQDNYEYWGNSAIIGDEILYVADKKANKIVDYCENYFLCLQRIYDIWKVITSYKAILYKRQPSKDDFCDALSVGLREYSKNKKAAVLHELKKSYKQIKLQRNVSMEEAWSIVYSVEEKTYELALSQRRELAGAKDKEIVIASYIRDEMEENPKLLTSIKNNDFENELFNIQDAVYKEKLLSYLFMHNLDLFYLLVLRRNIIKCKRYDFIESEFEEWLNDSDDNDEKEETKREPAELFTPKAMKLWKKLQDAGYIDSDYKPIKTQQNSERKFAVIASIMGGLLQLTPKWRAFTELWQIRNLENKFSQAQLTGYFAQFDNDIRTLLSD